MDKEKALNFYKSKCEELSKELLQFRTSYEATDIGKLKQEHETHISQIVKIQNSKVSDLEQQIKDLNKRMRSSRSTNITAMN